MKKQFCKRGHDWTLPGALTKKRECVLCKTARRYDFYIRHREEINTRRRNKYRHYYDTKGRKQKRSYYLKHRLKLISKACEYSIAHKEQVKIYLSKSRSSARTIKTLLTLAAISELAKKQTKQKDQ